MIKWRRSQTAVLMLPQMFIGNWCNLSQPLLRTATGKCPQIWPGSAMSFTSKGLTSNQVLAQDQRSALLRFLNQHQKAVLKSLNLAVQRKNRFHQLNLLLKAHNLHRHRQKWKHTIVFFGVKFDAIIFVDYSRDKWNKSWIKSSAASHWGGWTFCAHPQLSFLAHCQ